MSVRRILSVLLLLVAAVGVFFIGRASVSHTSEPTTGARHLPTVPSDFSPTSVSFTSSEVAWSLGTVSCASHVHCLELVHTSNRGRSWSRATLPAPLLSSADRNFNGVPAGVYGAASLNVRFANARDGWIFGVVPGPVPADGLDMVQYQPALWSTHDASATWHRVQLKGLGTHGALFDLEASAGEVHVLFQNVSYGVTVESSPVGVDAWRTTNESDLSLPAGGAPPSGSIVLRGTTGWLVTGNDRGVSGSARLRDGEWIPWTAPCASVGDSYAVPSASSPRDLVVICAMGGYASPLSPNAPPGATLGSSWLYSSSNGGDSFVAGPELSSGSYYTYSLVASPSAHTILLNGQPDDNTSRPFELVASFDGGIHWTKVYSGALSYLGFTSVHEGAGIVHPDHGRNSLILTLDGGRSWHHVSF